MGGVEGLLDGVVRGCWVVWKACWVVLVVSVELLLGGLVVSVEILNCSFVVRLLGTVGPVRCFEELNGCFGGWKCYGEFCEF